MKSYRTGQARGGYGWIAAERNFWLADPCVVRCNDQVTHDRKFGTATERVSVNRRNADAVGFADLQKDVMKFCNHLIDLARDMIRNVHASRERLVPCTRDHNDLCSDVFDLPPRRTQLVHHFQINDVQGRTIQDNARQARARMKFDCREPHGRLLTGGLPGGAPANGTFG